MKGKGKNHENEGFFMGDERFKMRSVLAKGEKEKGVCSSIMACKSVGFLSVKWEQQ